MKRFALLVTVLALCVSVYALPGQGRAGGSQSGIGETFHRKTALSWRSALGNVFRLGPEKPPPYKMYKQSKRIKLPAPGHHGMPVEEAIQRRRSVRHYSSKKMSKAQLSQLLFAAQGITGKMYGQPLRTAPSAGALYPFEVYLVVNNVEGLSRGIYHYAVLEHELELLKTGDFRKDITDAGLKQDMLGESAVTFVLSAIFNRVCHKYGERGYRYVYMEAGHISQNIFLQAVSLGLGSVGVGAFLDSRVNQLIDVDGKTEAAIYLHAVGTR